MALTRFRFETLVRGMIRTAPLLIAAVALAFGALVASARPVLACSCAGFQTMRDYVAPENAVFTGIAGAREARGVPVQVEQWLWGDGAAPLVWLSDASFGDGASCGTTPPTPGTSWIWVTWRSEDDEDFGTGLCSPHQRLDNPEGQAMLEEALAVLGGEAATPQPTEPPAAPQGTDPESGGIPVIALVGGGVAIATVALFGGLVLLARRQRPVA